jgi:predicted ATP-grasp superfamily ATP-dependent carboligase
LIQEKIEGEGRGVFLLVWNGKLKAAFCHRRLREKPPWGGVSVYRESLPLDQAMVERSFALLQAMEWQGVAMLEFKMDRRDGVAKLMEMNPRFWGSLQLATDAGMNFPLLLYRLACGENVPPQFEYRSGMKSRWLLGDLDHLWLTLTPRREHIFQTNGVSRLRACARFLKFFERGLHYEVGRFSDWRPGWYECRNYLSHVLRRRPA